MKAKLLKKLRKKFIINWMTIINMYEVKTPDNYYLFGNRKSAIEFRNSEMIKYGRYFYNKYAKKIQIFY